MPKTKQQKETIIKELQDKLAKSKIIVFSDYYGLKVPEVQELRELLKKEGAEYLVTKKTLLRLALADKEIDATDIKAMDGGVGIAFGGEDEVASPKILMKFAKVHEALKVSGGILEDKFIEAIYVKQLAELPSKPELIAKAVGSIAAPLRGFVSVLQGNLRKLVYALNAIKESKA